MKEKNGFTIIELIITIALILIVILMYVNNMEGVKRSQENVAYTRLINKINVASSSYVSSNIAYNNELRYGRGFVKLKIQELIENGYLDKDTIDPRDGNPINRNELALLTLNCSGELEHKFPLEETDDNIYFVESTPLVVNEMPDNPYINLNTIGLRMLSEKGNQITLKTNSNLATPGDIVVASRTYNTYAPGVYQITYNYIDNNGICRVHHREVIMY
ncbi:MAG: prepilin-type N-terminal cleavage/methylation domain-containing protein [Mollicutes bacterium]|jgi:prepilin-type N-terminal cleavage/methylation domain-containing protein|nr:prepilin-type N-terminal cleavage/methylation domain-containing protein [Mollicutes bacterium]